MINKANFDKYCEDYASKLHGRDPSHLLAWECQKNFQDNWDIEALDFLSMYNKSLHSNVSVRLWKRDGFFPKEVMQDFIELDKEFSRGMFRDLFNEDKEIDGRVSRFVYHCNIFLDELKKKHKLATAHFHDDLFMPSLYLAFKYPDNYTTYSFGLFRTFMQKMGARKIPEVDDIERYFKVMRIIQKFLLQNEELVDKLNKLLDDKMYYQEPSMFLAQDFEHFVLSCNY